MTSLTPPPTLSVRVTDSARLLKLKQMFLSKFGSDPKFYVRAPGRVNLIGEHIDYCGYAVLPMAIEQDILAAVEPVKNDVICLANTNPQYLDFTTSTNSIQIDKTKPLWHNYFLCGLKGIQDHFNFNKPTGMNCLVDGTVPPSSGLSSSSALVCCAGLITLTSNGMALSKVELAEACAKSERYIGTEGGGMDQSISFLGEEGTAKLIEFSPLRASDVKLPPGAVFVIANSCVEMNKAATSHFNIRVMECRLATKGPELAARLLDFTRLSAWCGSWHQFQVYGGQVCSYSSLPDLGRELIAKRRGLDWKSLSKLGDVQGKLGLSLQEMQAVVEEIFHREPYSVEEICGALGITIDELRATILSQNTQDVSFFKLYQRAKHVYSEAQRVLDFKEVCDEAPADAVQRLGALMSQSHESCKNMYECSCPEVDQLVNTCLQSGAIGSRLTGAGWGGCTVSMVPAGHQDAFIAKVQDAYYKDGSLALLKNNIFATKPASGALVLLEAANN